MRRFVLAAFASLAVAVPVAASFSVTSLPQSSLTCDPAALKPESYRLTVEAQALNLTKPRFRWWDNYDIGKAAKDVQSLNDAAIAIAERARQLDDRNLLAHVQLARHYVVGAVDARQAHEEWRRALDAGAAITWSATLREVDPSGYFVVAFDRAGIRIYRLGQLAGALKTRYGIPEFPGPDREELWRALGGCIGESVQAEATIPWSAVRELEAGTFSLAFNLDRRVTITSDRRKRREDDRIVVSLHGAAAEFGYATTTGYGPVGLPVRRGPGPELFQERIRGTLVDLFDPQGRIKLPKQQRLGFGW